MPAGRFMSAICVADGAVGSLLIVLSAPILDLSAWIKSTTQVSFVLVADTRPSRGFVVGSNRIAAQARRIEVADSDRTTSTSVLFRPEFSWGHRENLDTGRGMRSGSMQ